MALASPSTFSGLVVRTAKGVLQGNVEVLASPQLVLTVCGSSVHNRHAESAAGSNKWVNAWNCGVCPNCRRSMRTKSARCEVTCQSVLQKFSHTMADRDLPGGGSVTVRRTRDFAIANQMIMIMIYNGKK